MEVLCAKLANVRVALDNIMKLARNLLFLIGGGAALVAGCAKSETQPGVSQPAPAAAKASLPVADTAETAAGRTVEITANDQMKYGVSEIRASAGELLSVTLINAGKMPKMAMGHNWILLRQGADPLAYVSAGAAAAATDYEPASLADQVIVSTRLLGPGERQTVTFNAPTEPGEYTYVCSFPGHFQVGMKGVLIVE